MSDLKKISNIFLNPGFLLLVGAILLVIASFTGAPMGNDEGVWAYIGRLWADHGILPYSGAIENKATGIYMVYALSHKFFGFNIWFPRLLATISILGTGGILYILTKKIANQRAAFFAMAMFLLTMPLASVDGPYAETESFMNLFRVGAFLLLLIAYDKKREYWLILSGVSFAWAIAFKQLAVVDAIPLFFFHYILAEREWKMIVTNLFWTAVGLLVGTFVSLVPYLLSGGTIAYYIDGAWRILLQSGSSPPSIISRISGFFRHFFNVRLWWLTLGFFGFVAFRKRLDESTKFFIPLLAWVVSDFLAYNADGWYLDHHYKVFIPSWSIVFGITASIAIAHLSASRKELEEKYAVVAVLMLLLFFAPFEPNYFQHIRKAIKGDVFDHSARELGLYLKDRTTPNQYVYVWGLHIGQIYYYSDRQAPSRYFSEPFLGRPGALDEIKRDMLDRKPEFILVPLERPAPAWLQRMIEQRYHLIEERGGYSVYQRTVFL